VTIHPHHLHLWAPASKNPKPADRCLTLIRPQASPKKGKSMEEEHAPLNPERVDPLVHARKCVVCNHPERDEIEDQFVYWGHPGSIVKRFGLRHRTALYRHARALRLYEVRTSKLRSALEHIIERASITKVTSDSIVRAVQTYAHIDAQGKWEEPLRKVMAVQPVDEAKEIQFVVSQPMYDIIQQRKSDAERSARELQSNPMVNQAAREQQNRHP
jgi:hypothetical protein